MFDGQKHATLFCTTCLLQGYHESRLLFVRMACPRGGLCKEAGAQPPHLGIFGRCQVGIGHTYEAVGGVCHSTPMEYAMGFWLHPESPEKEDEMKVLVW